jgi:hypothetical protein
MLDACAGVAYALDPALLMERAGLVPDPWQRDLLRSEARRILVLAARQCGKSTTAAFLALSEALFRPRSLTLCVSPSQRQSGELFRRVVDGFRHPHVQPLAAVVAESALRIEFGNGSRVISLPASGETIRGFSGVSLLLLDEGARIEDSMLAAVRPMLATTDGRILAMSTGWLRHGWFYDAWMGTGGGEDWRRIEIGADACPRISAEFLAGERAALGDLVFKAEYGCSFVDETGCFFDPESVARCFRKDLAPLFPGEAA